MSENAQGIVFLLRKRAEIRRQIPGRKSVQHGEPDRIADLLEEAANEIERLTICGCGKRLSRGECRVCDNDD